MDKEMKQLHTLRVISNLNQKLMQIEMHIRHETVTGAELHTLEKMRLKYETRLMELYGTEKYGLVAN